MTLKTIAKTILSVFFRLMLGLVAIIATIFVASAASTGFQSEIEDVRTKAQLAAAKAVHNETQIKELEKKLNEKPAVIVVEKKNEKANKPFADDELLRRARKLRSEQQAAHNNR